MLLQGDSFDIEAEKDDYVHYSDFSSEEYNNGDNNFKSNDVIKNKKNNESDKNSNLQSDQSLSLVTED